MKKLVLLLISGGLLSLCALLAILSFPDNPTPDPVPELLLSELHKANGLFYAPNQTEPYTGVVLEYYPDDQLKSRTEIQQGLLHGLSEGWHTNGELQIRESFYEGISDGLKIKWHANGTRLSAGRVVQGKYAGHFRKWHENGQLAQQMELQEGVPNGLSQAWFPSGALKAQAQVKNGEVVEQQFFDDRQG